MTGTSIETSSNTITQPETENSSGAEFMTSEETREILTPFAFKIDKTLYGVALATPLRRLAAILIDLLLVAILSGAPGELLALFIAIVFFQYGSKKRAQQMKKTKGVKRRAFLRFVGALIIFVLLVDYLPAMIKKAGNVIDPEQSVSQQANSGELNNSKQQEIKVEQAIAFAAVSAKALTTVSNSQCKSAEYSDLNQAQNDAVTCWYNDLWPIVKELPHLSLPEPQVIEGIKVMAEVTELPLAQQSVLAQKLTDDFQQEMIKERQQRAETDNTGDSTATGADNSLNDNLSEDSDTLNKAFGQDEFYEQDMAELIPDTSVQDTKFEAPVEKKPTYSIVKLIIGIIDDLGLGFGWAAFYFTVFTALWQGQTPGKKALGIKVLQLDGTPLSLWDSFGRYGGYGAGIATGLLGFIQIFWDANRQAIHDQISSTVVVYASANSLSAQQNAPQQSKQIT